MFQGREWSLSSRKTRELFKKIFQFKSQSSQDFLRSPFSAELQIRNCLKKSKPVSKKIFDSYTCLLVCIHQGARFHFQTPFVEIHPKQLRDINLINRRCVQSRCFIAVKSSLNMLKSLSKLRMLSFSVLSLLWQGCYQARELEFDTNNNKF